MVYGVSPNPEPLRLRFSFRAFRGLASWVSHSFSPKSAYSRDEHAPIEVISQTLGPNVGITCKLGYLALGLKLIGAR